MEKQQSSDQKRHPVLSIGLIACLALIATAFLGVTLAQAAAPMYDIKATWADSNLPPGGEGQFMVQIHNRGDAAGSDDLTIADQLPPGVTATDIYWGGRNINIASFCSGLGTETVSCTIPGAFDSFIAPPASSTFCFCPITNPQPSGYAIPIFIDVDIDPGVEAIETNTATVSGGSAPTASDVDQVPFSATPAKFDLVPGSYEADSFEGPYPDPTPSRQAGDHPFEFRTNFDITARSQASKFDGTREARSAGTIKSTEATLPRALIGNPEAVPKCDPIKFAQVGATVNATRCPSNTQIGYVNIPSLFGHGFRGNGAPGTEATGIEALSRVPIYNLQPPTGTPVDLAFNAQGLVQVHIYATLDPGQNYAIKAVVPNISSLVDVRGVQSTFWGVPGDPAHDKFRYYSPDKPLVTGDPVMGAPYTGTIRPFFTNPMDCGFDNGGQRIRLDSYQHPNEFTPVQEFPDPMNVTGCDDPRFHFEPDISLAPTSKAAGGPTGLKVDLKIPQRNDEVTNAADLYAENGNVRGISTPHLKKAVVTLPEGMTVSPSAAQGLDSCTPDQIGMGTDSPVGCSDASQFGTMTLKTPLLPASEPAEGFLYVAKPFDNPNHNFLTLYLVIQEPKRGILVKLAGKADLDPQTGQITFSIDDLPQLPVEESTISVKGGLRAGLVNPQTCGKKVIDATFYTWQDPTTPHHVTNSYDITQNPDGSPCHPNLSERPFSPDLSGGTENNLAGAFSPLNIQLSRSDEDQELDRVEGTAPPGLLGSLKGVGRCTDAAIAAAANPERTGTEELEHPSCPADSLVGTVDAGSGVGQVLTYVPGKIYLAGPYKGAPISGVAIVPAVAGPFDLGNVVTRAPAYINPQTAELKIKTDALPQIFKGVVLRVRDIRIHLNRPHFTLNPTNCEPFSLGGTMFSTEGKSMNGGSRFQAADCASLGFAPKLSTQLFGGTTRGSHPKFKGIYRSREGDANVKSVVVTLPHSEFLDQSHIRTVCTRVQFAAGGGNGEQCPPASIYGHAEARTPLLEETLQGPVYLRSSSHKLPDLVAELHGIVDVEVVGRIDSIKGGIRASFEAVPDVPVESFKIAMQGGKKGLLVNSRNICAATYRIGAEFKAQNGKATTLRPKLKAKCSHKRKAKHR